MQPEPAFLTGNKCRSGRSFAYTPIGSRVLVVAICCALVGVQSASALQQPVGAEQAFAYLSESSRVAIESAEGRVLVVRKAMASDSFFAMADALLAAEGQSLPEPSLSTPGWSMQERMKNLPPAVQAPVAGLAATVEKANELFGSLSFSEVKKASRAMRRLLEGSEGYGLPEERLPVQAGSDQGRPSPSSAPRGPWFSPAIRQAIEMTAPASAMLAAALDRYVPELIAAARTLPSPANDPVEGCDLLDQTPILCVGSNVANIYGSDQAVLIDLGGNDVYRNSAGAAPFLKPGVAPGEQQNVSLNLDLSGNDVYSPDGPTDGWQVSFAQGSGNLAGVGYLVDLLGNDLYEVPGPSKTLWSQAQGTGVTGSGVLFDLGGDDKYRAVSDPEGGTFVAQGFGGANAGPAGLIDLGLGKDAYSFTGGYSGPEQEAAFCPAEGETCTASTVLWGQAASLLGASVLFDDGGEDAFLASLTGVSKSFPAPSTSVRAQGHSNVGTALLLEGYGNTSYKIESHGEGVVGPQAIGQSQAVGLTGLSVLEDLGGDDAYRLEASTTREEAIEVKDDCECRMAVAAAVQPSVPYMLGQGSAVGAGPKTTSLLSDHLGNDRYAAVGTSKLRVHLLDRLSQPEAPPNLAVVSAYPHMEAQGMTSLGNAVLKDASGNDQYEIRSLSDVVGEATSDNAVGDPTITRITAVNFLAGQGANLGALFDLAGTRDSFRVERLAIPDGSISFIPGAPLAIGDGVGGVFAALGADPRIVASPAKPLMCGTRGIRAWSPSCYGSPDGSPTEDDPDHQTWDSSPGWASIGLAPQTGAPGPPALSFTADTPGSVTENSQDNCGGDQRIDWSDLPTPLSPSSLRTMQVGAKLEKPVTAGGGPIRDALVHFYLGRQVRLVGTPFQSWFSAWHVTARTDENGLAHAQLPTWGMSCFVDEQAWAIGATYDGGPGEEGNLPFGQKHILRPVATG
jgi:hypothetical protein